MDLVVLLILVIVFVLFFFILQWIGHAILGWSLIPVATILIQMLV